MIAERRRPRRSPKQTVCSRQSSLKRHLRLLVDCRQPGECRLDSGRIVAELDKGESGPFPGAVYELRVIYAGLPLGWHARCTILELESSKWEAYKSNRRATR